MADNKINGYQLSRNWFDFAFENPELIRPIHSAIYFFAMEHCNRLGWKQKFGFPSQMAMDAIGVKNWRTYSKALNELVEWGFFIMVEKSKNQYSSNIIAIVKNTKAHTKALDKAMQKHSTKQSKSIVSIDKHINNKPITSKLSFNRFWDLYDKKVDKAKSERKWNSLKEHDKELIMAYIPKYKKSEPEKKFRKNPATFLNNKSWLNEIIEAKKTYKQEVDDSIDVWQQNGISNKYL